MSNLRLENAVLKQASSRITDIDAALKLIDRTGISITADGDVQGVEEALDALMERYPYVAADAEGAATDLDAILGGLQSSGRPNNGKRATDNAANITVLRKKFPALARMRK